ncbi:hypothetical protein NBRC116601_00420 [Cognatishimia sp. WU-CL00825]
MTNPNLNPENSQHPIAVSPDEAARLVGIGRTTLYAALAKGDLPSIKIGTRRLIRVYAIRDWLAKNEG